MTLAGGGTPIFPLMVPLPTSSYIWPAVQSSRRGLSTNPGVTMWCVCGAHVGAVKEMMCVMYVSVTKGA